MQSLAELIKLLAMLVALGAACWAGFAIIVSGPEFGNADPSGALRSAGIVFLVAVTASILASRITKGSR
ncbi:hypothetical protein N9L47_09305 [Rhodobacteraceae bacterium]|nr:hypothetical protein [Paracoccaceae bacterium]